MRNEYEITSSIQILIDDGYPVYPIEVIQWDMNITLIEDLVTCNLEMLDFLGKNNEIGKNVSIHPEAAISHSVIGDNVSIEAPISVSDSVVMPNTKISGKSDLKNAFVMEDKVIKINPS